MNDHLSNDQLRRAVRQLGGTTAQEQRAMRTTMRAVLDSDLPSSVRTEAFVGRRRFLQLGGLGVAMASVIAACGGTDSPGVARIGVAPERTDLPEGAVNDIVLLRTASSLERSVIAVYDQVIGNSDLLDSAYDDLAQRFRDDHVAHAELFESLTTEAGGEPWTCGNPRIDELLITPVFAAITASDDPKRDVLNTAHALEEIAGQTYQALVPLLSETAARRDAISVGATEVRHASLLALAITGRPDGYLVGEAPADPPPIPVVYAIPSAYGALAGVSLVVGKEDEVGLRQSFNLETPSLNTFVYEYLTPEC